MEEQQTRSKARSRKGCGCVAWSLVLIVLGLFGAVGYVATGPYRTLSTLRRALEQRDSTLLAQCVDFPTLRQNLKTQLMARANSGLNAVAQGGILSQIAGGIAGTVIDTSVDTFVTPAGLDRLLAGASLAATAASSASGDAPPSRLDSAEGSFESIDKFLVTVPAASSTIVLELSRNGLDWQVTNVRLPPSTP